MKIPQQVRDLVEKHHQGGVSGEVCLACSSGCCSQGGFAIIENVLEIYKLYEKGALKRRGYKFRKGLPLKDFIFAHFDVWERDTGPESDPRPLMFFHMKSIDQKGRLITLPGYEPFWKIRSHIFDFNPWLSWGCVFLSHKVPNWPVDDGYRKRHCILHRGDDVEEVGPKPIDCVFYTCTRPYRAKVPTKEETKEWFAALGGAFPRSKERFGEITGRKPDSSDSDKP